MRSGFDPAPATLGVGVGIAIGIVFSLQSPEKILVPTRQPGNTYKQYTYL
jgi:hypothetical protein